MRRGGQWARFSSPLWACQRTLPGRVCAQDRLHTHLPLLIQSQRPCPVSQSGEGGSDEKARAAATHGPRLWVAEPPVSGCGKATSGEARCAVHFLSPRRFSRGLSLQLPLVSSQKQRKCGNRNQQCQGGTRPALGPQRGLFLNRSAPGRVRGGRLGSGDFLCVRDGVHHIYYNSPPMWVLLLCGHRAVVTSEGHTAKWQSCTQTPASRPCSGQV